MHACVQWKVHRRNVIIIVARFAYATGMAVVPGRDKRGELKEGGSVGARWKRERRKVG